MPTTRRSQDVPRPTPRTVDEVLRMITEAETRKRQRVSRADAFKQAVEGFLGDLLAAAGEGWVYRATGRSHFTGSGVLGSIFEIVAAAKAGGR